MCRSRSCQRANVAEQVRHCQGLPVLVVVEVGRVEADEVVVEADGVLAVETGEILAVVADGVVVVASGIVTRSNGVFSSLFRARRSAPCRSSKSINSQCAPCAP